MAVSTCGLPLARPWATRCAGAGRCRRGMAWIAATAAGWQRATSATSRGPACNSSRHGISDASIAMAARNRQPRASPVIEQSGAQHGFRGFARRERRFSGCCAEGTIMQHYRSLSPGDGCGGLAGLMRMKAPLQFMQRRMNLRPVASSSPDLTPPMRAHSGGADMAAPGRPDAQALPGTALKIWPAAAGAALGVLDAAVTARQVSCAADDETMKRVDRRRISGNCWNCAWKSGTQKHVPFRRADCLRPGFDGASFSLIWWAENEETENYVYAIDPPNV